MGDFPGPGPVELAALARKYAALAALRARRDSAGLGATRAELRVLAAEFPGCLRELDTLGAGEIARRAVACGEAAAGAAAEPWMAWIAAYHALMARALEVRGAGKPGRAGTDAFEQAALAPPGGRVNVVVLREIGERFGVPAATVATALFPVRRRSPYAL